MVLQLLPVLSVEEVRRCGAIAATCTVCGGGAEVWCYSCWGWSLDR